MYGGACGGLYWRIDAQVRPRLQRAPSLSIESDLFTRTFRHMVTVGAPRAPGRASLTKHFAQAVCVCELFSVPSPIVRRSSLHWEKRRCFSRPLDDHASTYSDPNVWTYVGISSRREGARLAREKDVRNDVCSSQRRICTATALVVRCDPQTLERGVQRCIEVELALGMPVEWARRGLRATLHAAILPCFFGSSIPSHRASRSLSLHATRRCWRPPFIRKVTSGSTSTHGSLSVRTDHRSQLDFRIFGCTPAAPLLLQPSPGQAFDGSRDSSCHRTLARPHFTAQRRGVVSWSCRQRSAPRSGR